MGEAKRRKKLDPNYGKVSRNKTELDLDLMGKFLDLPASEYSEAENNVLVEQGLEQLWLMAKKAGVEMPKMPEDPEERQKLIHQLKQNMSNARLEMPDGSIADI